MKIPRLCDASIEEEEEEEEEGVGEGERGVEGGVSESFPRERNRCDGESVVRWIDEMDRGGVFCGRCDAFHLDVGVTMEGDSVDEGAGDDVCGEGEREEERD